MSRGVRFLSSARKSVPMRANVLIVGAGPSGLMLSLLLHKYKVSNVLIDGAAELSSHPQAHFLNTRSSEIIQSHFPDLHEDLLSSSPHLEEWRSFTFGNGVVPSAGLTTLGRYDHFSSLASSNLSASSPTRATHLSQDRITSLLLKHHPDPGGVLFSTRLTSLDGTEAKTSNPAHPAINADFVIGADGAHSLVRREIDVRLEGNASLQSLLSIEVSAMLNVKE